MNKRPLDQWRIVDPHWGVVYEGSIPPDWDFSQFRNCTLQRKHVVETYVWEDA